MQIYNNLINLKINPRTYYQYLTGNCIHNAKRNLKEKNIQENMLAMYISHRKPR